MAMHRSLALAILGGVGGWILLAHGGSHEPEVIAFTATPAFVAWRLFFAAQVAFYAVAIPAAWARTRPLLGHLRETAWESGTTVLLVVGIVWVGTSARADIDWPLPCHVCRVSAAATLALALLVVCTLGITCGLAAVRQASEDPADGTPDWGGRLRRLGALRRDRRQFIRVLSGAVALAVLSTGALRAAALAWDPGVSFGIHLVLAYGLFFTLVVAFLHYAAEQRQAPFLSDFAERASGALVPDPSDWLDRADAEARIRTKLGVDEPFWASFSDLAAIAAPLTAAVGSLLLR